jgi:hypothetical protein
MIVKIVDMAAAVIVFLLLSVIEITKGTKYNIEIAVPGGTARSIMNIISIILVVRDFDVIKCCILLNCLKKLNIVVLF